MPGGGGSCSDGVALLGVSGGRDCPAWGRLGGGWEKSGIVIGEAGRRGGRFTCMCTGGGVCEVCEVCGAGGFMWAEDGDGGAAATGAGGFMWASDGLGGAGGFM